MPVSADEVHGQRAVQPSGLPVKAGVYIQPVIVEGGSNIGAKYRVRIKIYGDIKVQLPIAL